MGNELNRCGHERYEELCALAMSGSLTGSEQADLQVHLEECSACREEYERYLLLAREGMPHLARRYGNQDGIEISDRPPFDEDPRLTSASLNASQRVLAEIASSEPQIRISVSKLPESGLSLVSGWRAFANSGFGVAAACLLVVAAYGSYQLAQRTSATKQTESLAQRRAEALTSQRQKIAGQLNAQTQKLAELEADSSHKKQEIEKLESRLRDKIEGAEQRAAKLSASLNATEDAATEANANKARLEEQLQVSVREREALAARLRDLESAYQSAQVELVNLRAERDRATLRLASLEVENTTLEASSHDQEKRLRSQEQYLASDRDIRELMGARQLYMADVFDVSSDSRTRKPYGRIFYTKSKSLIFYAFDLDRQPGIKNAAFQAWGRNESSQTTPVNLGILYQDSEQNRRWFLRLDDPKQLAEIDAVFVTIEPHGGSSKPTGKPFLYASLRREPNHP